MNDFEMITRKIMEKRGKTPEQINAMFAATQCSKPDLQSKVNVMNAVKGDLHGYDCPICKNKGCVYIVKNNDIVAQDCKCLSHRRTLRNIRESGLAEHFAECKFTNFKTEQPFQMALYDKATAYLKEEHKWFFVGGQSGCGKTHICTAICGQLIKQGLEVHYMPYRDEIVKIKQSSTDRETYQGTLDRLKKVQVLYIDDFFKGDIRPSDVNIMYEIIGDRYNSNRRTIFSSEMLFDNIAKIDQAIAGRIRERCGKSEYLLQIAKDSAKNYRMR